MASPADTVFGVPELLEQILFFVYEIEHRELVPEELEERFRFWSRQLRRNSICCRREDYMYPEASQRLFALRRVSRTFQATILGSFRLKCRMGLQNSRNQRSETSSDVGAISLKCGLFASKFRIQGYVWRRNSGPGEANFCIGTSPSKVFPTYELRRPLWHELKITTVEVPVRIKVDVQLYVTKYLRTKSSYKEVLDFEAGGGTLGDIVDLLDTIYGRSILTHWRLAHRETSMSVRSALRVAILTPTSILALVLLPHILRGVFLGRMTELFKGVGVVIVRLISGDSATWFMVLLASLVQAVKKPARAIVVMLLLTVAAWMLEMRI